MDKTCSTIVRDATTRKLMKERDVLEIGYHVAKDSGELNMVITDKLVDAANKLKDTLNETGSISIDDIVEVQEILDKIKHEAPYNMGEYNARQEATAISEGRFDLNVILDKVVREEKQ